MTHARFAPLWAVATLCLAAAVANAQEPFSKLVGPVKVGDVQTLTESNTLEMPFILWGGDAATFYANGDTTTKPGTIYEKIGLKLKLYPGDDFVAQVKNYMEGKSAFLRGTASMLGLASEVLNSDPRTRPVVFLQLTWSRGDHMVGRDKLKTLNDLKGKKIALQKNGPHVGMLDDILKTAKLTWKDIQVVWTDDVTGEKGPAAAFKKDESIDGCFVVTPDMQALTGGLKNTGSGAEGTVKGAHVVVSTADLTHSIADVYACRKDFYDKHRDLIEKFAAGYLKASEEVVAMKPSKMPENKGDPAKYKALCKLTKDIYDRDMGTKGALKNEEDADGLISDCIFVRLPGNYSFFREKSNLIGFEERFKDAVALAVAQGYAAKPSTFLAADFDYEALKKLGDLKDKAIELPPSTFTESSKPEKQIYSFVILFDPDQEKFSVEKYGNDFQQVVRNGKLYGNALIEIRGHSDPTNLVQGFLKAALQAGVVKEQGAGYVLADGSKLDLNDGKKIAELIDKGNLPAKDKEELKNGLEYFQRLSQQRAEEVRKAITDYATSKGYTIDPNQLKVAGVGAMEPASIVIPAKDEERAKNRRVEFRISTAATTGK